jgi:hypothetical protein
VAATNCGKYFFQNAHCLNRGPRPIVVTLIANSKYCLSRTVCLGQSGKVGENPGFGSLF